MGLGFCYPSAYLDNCLFYCSIRSNGRYELCEFGGQEPYVGLSSGQLRRISNPGLFEACSSRFARDNSNRHFGIDRFSISISCNYCIPRTFALAKISMLLAILPFWTSYVVRSYAWLLVLAREGLINQALLEFGIISDPLTLANTRFATVTGFVHFFVMLLTLTIYANLKQLSPNYRLAAMDLGANPFQTFRYVIMPLTLPGIVTGAFLTFVLCIGDYVTPQILGGNNELTIPQVIMVQLGRRADFPLASALAIVMMGMVTLAYLAAARWLRIDRV